MKPLKCLFGWHDYEVVETSDSYGWCYQTHDSAPIKSKKDHWIVPEKRAVNAVCLRCGHCYHGIDECKQAYEELYKIKENKVIAQIKRKSLAKDLYSMCKKETK